MQKNIFETKLKNAIEDLSKVWNEIVELCYDAEIDINDYIVKNYPFHCSFDEINIDDWKNSVLENIEKSKSNIDKTNKSQDNINYDY